MLEGITNITLVPLKRPNTKAISTAGFTYASVDKLMPDERVYVFFIRAYTGSGYYLYKTKDTTIGTYAIKKRIKQNPNSLIAFHEINSTMVAKTGIVYINKIRNRAILRR